MPDYQFTRFPIPGKRVDFEAIQNEITTLQEMASELQRQLDALTESTVPETRTVNGLDLTEDRVLKSAQFAESVTGEKMLANLLYSQVSAWDSGAKKSIKMAGDTYLDASGIVMSDHTTLDASHANYTKYPDGTLIQWGVINISTPKSLTGTQQGQLYYHEYIVNEVFPIPFIAIPSLILSKSGGRMASIGWASFAYDKIVEIDMLSGLQTLSAESTGVIINWVAVGKWK